MKILKYLLIVVVLLGLYITYPIWKLNPVVTVADVQEMEEQQYKQQDERKNITSVEDKALREAEEKFGPKPSVAYKSRVPGPLQRYWDETLKANESIDEDICSPLKATAQGWTTTCQFKIKSDKGISPLNFETYSIRDGKVVR